MNKKALKAISLSDACRSHSNSWTGGFVTNVGWPRLTGMSKQDSKYVMVVTLADSLDESGIPSKVVELNIFGSGVSSFPFVRFFGDYFFVLGAAPSRVHGKLNVNVKRGQFVVFPCKEYSVIGSVTLLDGNPQMNFLSELHRMVKTCVASEAFSVEYREGVTLASLEHEHHRRVDVIVRIDSWGSVESMSQPRPVFTVIDNSLTRPLQVLVFGADALLGVQRVATNMTMKMGEPQRRLWTKLRNVLCNENQLVFDDNSSLLVLNFPGYLDWLKYPTEVRETSGKLADVPTEERTKEQQRDGEMQMQSNEKVEQESKIDSVVITIDSDEEGKGKEKNRESGKQKDTEKRIRAESDRKEPHQSKRKIPDGHVTGNDLEKRARNSPSNIFFLASVVDLKKTQREGLNIVTIATFLDEIDEQKRSAKPESNVRRRVRCKALHHKWISMGDTPTLFLRVEDLTGLVSCKLNVHEMKDLSLCTNTDRLAKRMAKHMKHILKPGIWLDCVLEWRAESDTVSVVDTVILDGFCVPFLEVSAREEKETKLTVHLKRDVEKNEKPMSLGLFLLNNGEHVRVAGIEMDSPFVSQVVQGDRIVSINGKKIDSIGKVSAVLRSFHENEGRVELEIVVLRPAKGDACLDAVYSDLW